MKTLKLISLFLFALVPGLISCVDDIMLEGNGDLRSEFRAASGFNEIYSSGDFKVIVKPGDQYSIEVSAESNLLSYIETDVVGSTLKIRTRGVRSLVNNYPVEIFITTPALKGLSLSGSGFIKTSRFLSDDFKVALSGSGDIESEVETEHIKANISGSGNIVLLGEAITSEFVISGSGKIKAYDLPHNTCDATISGSGNMYINANEAINARISGSGNVYYINYPVIHTSISGSGGVINSN
ncbi:MAG: head GIN domain-containing protein [Methylococcaceae bacterium]|nr:head GIN domain-containing protein [Prolixibacteraceae bacterium]